MAKFNRKKNCIELEATDVIGPGESFIPRIYTGVRCKDCGYYHIEHMVCNRPCEHPVMRDPDDFCSGASNRRYTPNEERRRAGLPEIHK